MIQTFDPGNYFYCTYIVAVERQMCCDSFIFFVRNMGSTTCLVCGVHLIIILLNVPKHKTFCRETFENIYHCIYEALHHFSQHIQKCMGLQKLFRKVRKNKAKFGLKLFLAHVIFINRTCIMVTNECGSPLAVAFASFLFPFALN